MEEKSTLMGEEYFISPKYTCQYKGNRLIEFNRKDSLGNWLMNNSIFFGHPVGGGDGEGSYSDRRLFNDLNGVLCEIKHTWMNGAVLPKIEPEEELYNQRMSSDEFVAALNEREMSLKAVEGYYSRVARMRWMPINKEIPSELMAKLKDLGYKSPLETDSELLRRAENMFFRHV